MENNKGTYIRWHLIEDEDHLTDPYSSIVVDIVHSGHSLMGYSDNYPFGEGTTCDRLIEFIGAIYIGIKNALSSEGYVHEMDFGEGGDCIEFVSSKGNKVELTYKNKKSSIRLQSRKLSIELWEIREAYTHFLKEVLESIATAESSLDIRRFKELLELKLTDVEKLKEPENGS